MNFVNLTPHAINVFDEEGQQVMVIEKSGQEVRISISKQKVGSVLGIPLYKTTLGELTSLPEPAANTIYIVSGLVRSYVIDRTDVFQPGELIRDNEGKPVGCVGLSR